MNAVWLENRMRSAVRQVLKTYAIGEIDDDDDTLTFGVAKGKRKYQVTVDRGWRRPPTCTCPDMTRVGNSQRQGYCKHAIAVLLGSDDHRHQLLDLLL